MKNTISLFLTVAFVILFSSASGQDCSLTTDRLSGVSLRVKSTEITSITGQLTLQVVVKAKRRIYFPSQPYLDNQFSTSLFSEEPSNALRRMARRSE